MTGSATLDRLNERLRKADTQLRTERAERKRISLALVTSRREHRQLLIDSRSMQAQLRNLTRRLLSAQEEERKTISHELHDSIAQILAAINVHLATLNREAALTNTGFKKRIAHTQLLVSQSLDAVHTFARELRPKLLDDLGLVPALRSFLKTFFQQTRVRADITAFPNVNQLDLVTRTVLFRVAQEALTNVARHARASAVAIVIEELPRTIRMAVRDDGQSFDVNSIWRAKGKKRFGLLSMRERTEMIGGELRIHSAPNDGTTVTVEVPKLKFIAMCF